MTNPAYLNRNHPAHHAPLARHNTPVIVQLSVCTKDRLPVLACEAGHRLCRKVWQTADFWRVGQYVIMPDHIHLFCASGRVPPTSLRQWVAFWKSRIAAQWPGASGDHGGSGAVPTATGFKLWQRDFWDTQMRSREHYAEKLSYVRMNPVRKGLSVTPEAWPYQGQIFPIAWL